MAGVHHTTKRRAWNDAAIMKIKVKIMGSANLEYRFGKIPKPL
jgi:hypothetical protein